MLKNSNQKNIGNESFVDKNTLDNIPLESPLNKYAYQLDKKMLGKNLFEYYAKIEKVDSKYITNLLLKDFEYRFNSQLNILAEIYGQQGCGKSLFGQDLAYRTGKIFGVDFAMDSNTVADFDVLDSILHNSPYRSTFVVDEQPTSMFGYGSSRVMRGLKDYEEICRYTMKNIYYIAPTEREHSSYYVFKEDSRPSVERFRNQKCLNCPKQIDCLKIFSENKFQTLCDLPFWKRHGYPIAFNFMLITARKTDNHLMPRGYIRLPILPPKLMKQYDKIKKRNLDFFEQKESAGWTQQRAELRVFQEQYKDRLLKPDGKIVSKDLIKVYLQDYFGGRAFTTSELDMFTAVVKAEILSPEFVDTTQKELNERMD